MRRPYKLSARDEAIERVSSQAIAFFAGGDVEARQHGMTRAEYRAMARGVAWVLRALSLEGA